MRSVMKHQFSGVPSANIQRSVFDRSCGYKTTFDAGYLIPVYVDEALPGDSFKLKATMFARMLTPQKPIMDNVFLRTYFFSVPMRLVWNNFQRFMGERDPDPDSSIDYTIPQMVAPVTTGYAIGSLSDYLTIPTGIAELSHSSLWHRCYNLIWNSWFRDQNIQDSVTVDMDDGPDDPDDYVLKRVNKRHDYFTSALPWPQKGDAVTIDLGGTAPVVGTGEALYVTDGSEIGQMKAPSTSQDLQYAANVTGKNIGDSSAADGDYFDTTAPYLGVPTTTPTGLQANLASVEAFTINSLRQSFQIQRLLERDARGGTRYIEQVKSHFNVDSPDLRATRPEYLGGSVSPLIVNAVAQTSDTDATVTPQGNLAAYAHVTDFKPGFTKSFTEHCLLLGLVCVNADLTYQQGLDRMFSRSTRYDFYFPVLSHLGEQEIYNKELYAQNDANDDLVFGYQERFAEYRYKRSNITGKYRSTASGTLDYWHLSQKFDSLPTLNSTFIEENPPIDRVVAVQDEPQFMFDSYFKIKCARPMPVYSVPGLIDHF